MRARLLWTLLLLAAVLSVHGPSCVASASEPAGMSMPAATATAPVPDASGAAALGASPDAPAGHDMAAHALVVCLAVLAGGAGVVLAARLARRRVLTVVPQVPGRVRVVVARAVACAPPPELSRLCVLRV